MTTHIESAGTTSERRRRRRGAAVLKFGLAGAALLGIAAAATSAAWSDDAWFSASATAATVELEGSLTSADAAFVPADSGHPIEISSAYFQNLNENTTTDVTVYVRNAGSVPLTLGAPTVERSGDVFTGANATAVQVTVKTDEDGQVAGTVLPADKSVVAVTVTVTTPAGWPASNQGHSGSLSIGFSGQS